MKINEKVKEIRLEFGLTQEQLGRAIFREGATISQYENGKRNIDLETLNKIAEVFGYSIEFNLIEKKNKKDKNFYKLKSASEIMRMSDEDKVEYLFIVGENKIIANLCKLPINIIDTLPMDFVKDSIRKAVKETESELLFDIINNTYNGKEIEIRRFINFTKEYLATESNVPSDILEKTHYLQIDCRYNYRDGYWGFYNIQLLDENKNDLNIKREDIDCNDLPLDNELEDEVGEYLDINPILKIK